MSGTIHTAEDANEALAQLSELTLKDAEVTPPPREDTARQSPLCG
jgi:hypothetical protein